MSLAKDKNCLIAVPEHSLKREEAAKTKKKTRLAFTSRVSYGRRDSNPRTGISRYTISNRAPSQLKMAYYTKRKIRIRQ